MTVYISTGGFSKISANKVIKKFKDIGIKDIELSGGKYKPNLIFFVDP